MRIDGAVKWKVFLHHHFGAVMKNAKHLFGALALFAAAGIAYAAGADLG